MEIEEIVQALNAESPRFAFGRLQEIRQRLIPLNRKPSHTPFGPRATFDHFAFHVGGHDELQFNVGFDTNGDVRWGVAISLQRTQSIPDVSVLFPKLDRLSEFIRVHGDDHLRGFRMWHHSKQGRSEDRLPEVIPPSRYAEGVFLFLGKHAPVHTFDAEAILHDLDRLLPLYEYVEHEASDFPILDDESGFTFKPGHRSGRRYHTVSTGAVGRIEVSLRHSRIQDVLEQELRSELGDQVGSEHPDGIGGRVDVIAQREGDLEFYEIKIGRSAHSCIRQALGQLVEYGFWPGAARPAKLVVVGEPLLDEAAERFLQGLREEFGIPIYYRQVALED